MQREGVAMEQAANETIGDPADQDLAQVLADYAKAARGTAIKNRSKGDGFGDDLATKRAAVYEMAADLVRRLPREEAAKQMLENARSAHIRTPPLIDFDRAGVQYSQARAWQFCARLLDPSLPEVAPKWD
ncbi:MAG TPA: hypothetical protein VGN81_10495 [Pseudonocardiaceae bacterium]|jgi:hypothetical protein